MQRRELRRQRAKELLFADAISGLKDAKAGRVNSLDDEGKSDYNACRTASPRA
jgi:hypothetical protein